MVLVGDTAVGKSYLISTYFDSINSDFQNPFTEDHVPKVLDARKKNWRTKRGEIVEVEVHDTSADQQSADNRKVVYEDADVFMICFARNDPGFFEHAVYRLAHPSIKLGFYWQSAFDCNVILDKAVSFIHLFFDVNP